VFYFTATDSEYIIYMGKDKFENEDLIKWGWPEDIWFHVDDMSSAHVYLRLVRGQSIQDIPADVLEDCAQLVKANSINGNKVDNVVVIYTPWDNLKKTPGMEVGQVGFHDDHQVFKTKVSKRVNMIVNRLNKTKEERTPDLAAERDKRDQGEKTEKKAVARDQKRKDKEISEKKKQEAELKSYDTMFKSASMRSNKDNADDDDFM